MFVCLFVCLLNVNAQQCGTEPPLNYQTYENSSTSSPSAVTPNYCINIAFRILRNNDGTNQAIDPNIITQVLSHLNSNFNSHGISFIQVGTYDYIDNTSYNNYVAPTTSLSLIPNCLNIFFIKNFLNSNGSQTSIGGISSFGTLRARIKGDGALNGNIIHEVGHSLNLIHTFSCTNPCSQNCAESPYNNDNCDSRGDKICDTPADYNPFLLNPGQNQALHCYPVTAYNPDLTNFMSYWSNKNHFTLGQGVRMRNAISNAPQLQTIRSNKCAVIEGPEYICSNGNNTFNIVGYGTPLNYSWSVSNNLIIVGSLTSSSVVIQSSDPNNTGNASITVVVNGVTKTKTIAIGGPIIYANNQVFGLYDWVSVGYGNMGLIAQSNSTITSYKWIIEEDTDFINNCSVASKPKFVNFTSSPYVYQSTSNQAIVNWGTCSNSYLISCYAINECGATLYTQRYVDVGLPKNNPCYKNTVLTIIAPNPIRDKQIQIVVNKTPQQSPCNWKDRYTLQDFNNKIDQTKNTVSIYDFNGNLIHTQVYETDEFTIRDLNLIEGDNYIVNLTTNEGIFTQQIIIVE